MIRPDLRSREELVEFLRWKGSNHVIDQINSTNIDRNNLKSKNRATKEKGQKGTQEELKERKEHNSQTKSQRTQDG